MLAEILGARGPVAMAPVATTVAAVAARMHEDHSAEYGGVEHDRQGDNTGRDKDSGNERDEQPGHEPPWQRRCRLVLARGRGLWPRAATLCGGIVNVSRHGRAASQLSVVDVARPWRATMNRAMASAAIPSPINCAVLRPNKTAGSSRR